MRRRLPRIMAVPVAVAVLVLSAVPAAGQTIPTTPVPEPANPGQPPMSSPPNPAPKGRVIADAGTALGMVRVSPEAVPAKSVLPGAQEQSPRQSALEGGFGLSTAQANSEAFLNYERSIAEASPFGLAVEGSAPRPPRSLTQTALPDNPEPRTTDWPAPDNPLVKVHGLSGSVHARWSETHGPCVGTIADASTSAASVALLDAIPALPDTGGLTRAGSGLVKGLAALPGPLADLGGLLSDSGSARADGTGALVSTPNTMATRSTVRLVDLPGTDRKAAESTSVLQAGRIDILKGSALGLTVRVASPPVLRVTSTGDRETSGVEYTAPVLAVERDGKTLFELDAAHPTRDVPIGIPLPELKDIPGFEHVKDQLVIGGAAELADGGIAPLAGDAAGFVVDIAVLRLSIAGLTRHGTEVTTPFEGYHLGASARMLDVQVLPTQALADAMPQGWADRMPSSLARVSLGEQVASAYVPSGGIDCGVTAAVDTAPGGTATPASNTGAPATPHMLAQTSAAYATVPLFWVGTAMLLLGVVLVAGLPVRRESPAPTRPSPRPRER